MYPFFIINVFEVLKCWESHLHDFSKLCTCFECACLETVCCIYLLHQALYEKKEKRNWLNCVWYEVGDVGNCHFMTTTVPADTCTESIKSLWNCPLSFFMFYISSVIRRNGTHPNFGRIFDFEVFNHFDSAHSVPHILKFSVSNSV